MEYFRFFFGTPRRLLGSLIGIALVAVLINPAILEVAVNRLLQAVGPVIGIVLQIGIVIFAIKVIAGIGGKK